MRLLPPVIRMQLEEDFTRWRDDPMTRLVMKAFGEAAKTQKVAWDAASWGGGMVRADDLKTTLQELRIRADCYAAIGEMTFADVATWLGIEDNAE